MLDRLCLYVYLFSFFFIQRLRSKFFPLWKKEKKSQSSVQNYLHLPGLPGLFHGEMVKVIWNWEIQRPNKCSHDCWALYDHQNVFASYLYYKVIPVCIEFCFGALFLVQGIIRSSPSNACDDIPHSVMWIPLRNGTTRMCMLRDLSCNGDFRNWTLGARSRFDAVPKTCVVQW